MILLDTNIVIDLIEAGRSWRDWTRAALGDAIATDKLVTSTVVLAECAGHFPSSAAQRDYLAVAGIGVEGLGPVAAFHAGIAHRNYRRAGGAREAILADFLIGGHAIDLGAALLTRDRQRFAAYFPDLSLITPETHPHG